MTPFSVLMGLGLIGLWVFVLVLSMFIFESLRGIKESQRIQAARLDQVMQRFYSRRNET